MSKTAKKPATLADIDFAQAVQLAWMRQLAVGQLLELANRFSAQCQPALVAVLWSSSTRLGVGPTALTSLLIGASLTGLADPGSAEGVALAAWMALLSGMHPLVQGGVRFCGVVLSAGWNLAEADALVRETCLRLWDEFDKYVPGSSFAAWSLTVAHYEVLTWRKRASRSRSSRAPRYGARSSMP